MKSGLEDRNNRSRHHHSYDTKQKVSMKSGLEDRNNKGPVHTYDRIY